MAYRDQIGLTGYSPVDSSSLMSYSPVPYTGLGGSFQPTPAAVSGIDSIEASMIAAFEVALDNGGQVMNFAFSDGVTPQGRIYAELCVLWVTDESAYLNRHSHQYNPVVFLSEQKFQMRARDVPYGARLYANDYLDISDPCALIMTSYKIVSNIMKLGILTVTLNAMRTTPESGGITA